MHPHQEERDAVLGRLADALLATDPHLRKLKAENPHEAFKRALTQARARMRTPAPIPQMLTGRDQQIVDRDARVSARAEELLSADAGLGRLYAQDARKGYIAALHRASREIGG